VGRRGAIAQRRRSDVTAAVALEWDAQQPLPGFAPRVRDSLPRVERDAYDELTRGPFGLCVTEIAGVADEAHRKYRKRGVPLAWVHHNQLARALGLVVLRDPVVTVAFVIGSLIRLPDDGSPRSHRWSTIHECAEHLLSPNARAEHADVQALTIMLHVDRHDVRSAVRAVGFRRAHTLLARTHRRTPAWILRTAVVLWMVEKPL
jgi:hypothetical protein